MNETVVTTLTICLLNDDEIQIDVLHTKFYVYMRNGDIYSDQNMPLDELFQLFTQQHIYSLFIPAYPRYVEDEFGEEVVLTDDFLIFPQGIAHIETDASAIEV